jgi:hypothetical protein
MLHYIPISSRSHPLRHRTFTVMVDPSYVRKLTLQWKISTEGLILTFQLCFHLFNRSERQNKSTNQHRNEHIAWLDSIEKERYHPTEIEGVFHWRFLLLSSNIRTHQLLIAIKNVNFLGVVRMVVEITSLYQ